jgi:hypothetical protein
MSYIQTILLLTGVLGFQAHAHTPSRTAKLTTKTREANTFAEIQGKQVRIPSGRWLDLEGYNGDEKIAFCMRPNDRCVLTLSPVADFPQSGAYALEDKAITWKVGALKAEEKIKSTQDCHSLPFMYRKECVKSLERLDPYYLAPASVVLTSADGKSLGVYSKDSYWGVFKCIKNSLFELPRYEIPGETVTTAVSGAKAAH